MPPRQRKADTRTGDRHKRYPITVRFSDAIWERLERFAGKAGKPERTVVRDAVTDYLDRHDPENTPETTKES